MSKVTTHVREEGFAPQCAMKESPASDPEGSVQGLVSEALPYLGETCTQRDGGGNRFHKKKTRRRSALSAGLGRIVRSRWRSNQACWGRSSGVGTCCVVGASAGARAEAIQRSSRPLSPKESGWGGASVERPTAGGPGLTMFQSLGQEALSSWYPCTKWVDPGLWWRRCWWKKATRACRTVMSSKQTSVAPLIPQTVGSSCRSSQAHTNQGSRSS